MIAAHRQAALNYDDSHEGRGNEKRDDSQKGSWAIWVRLHDHVSAWAKDRYYSRRSQTGGKRVESERPRK